LGFFFSFLNLRRLLLWLSREANRMLEIERIHTQVAPRSG
jgi:hypothetical protein